MTGPTIPGLSTATSSLSTTSPLPLSYHPNPTATHNMSRCTQDGQNAADDTPYCPTNVLHPEYDSMRLKTCQTGPQKGWGRGRSMKRGAGEAYKVCLPFFLSFFTTQLTLSYPTNRTLPNTNTCKWACIWHPPPLQLMLWHDGGVFDLPLHQNARWGVCSSTTTPSAYVSMQQHQEKGRMIILPQFTLIYRELYKMCKSSKSL